MYCLDRVPTIDEVLAVSYCCRGKLWWRWVISLRTLYLVNTCNKNSRVCKNMHCAWAETVIPPFCLDRKRHAFHKNSKLECANSLCVIPHVPNSRFPLYVVPLSSMLMIFMLSIEFKEYSTASEVELGHNEGRLDFISNIFPFFFIPAYLFPDWYSSIMFC